MAYGSRRWGLDSAPNAHSGKISYAPNAFGSSNATVQQALSTVAGQKYDLTFYYQYDSNGPITVMFDGSAVAFTTTPGAKGWDLGTATGLVASGTTTDLDFSAIGADTLLDDVSVTAEAGPVPEPASLALLTVGVLGLAAQRRYRGKRSDAA